jgi:hypothetical protein
MASSGSVCSPIGVSGVDSSVTLLALLMTDVRGQRLPSQEPG